MADSEKDLRHMKRNDLVEIIYQYQQNEKTLREENEALKKALEDKSIKIDEAGSLAEAALKLNGVFEAAQAAAEQYLTEVRALTETAKSKEQKILDDAQIQADALCAQTKIECSLMKHQTSEECKRLKEEVRQFLQSQDGLRELLKGFQ